MKKYEFPKQRQCAECYKEFSLNFVSSNAKFCSRECALSCNNRLRAEQARLRRLQLPRRPCEICGTEFIVRNCNAKQRTCSPQCAGKIKTKQKTVICKNCHAEFSTFVASAKTFCSPECRYKFMRGPENGKWKPLQRWVCFQCGKNFESTKNHRNRTRRFCSQDCSAKWKSIHGKPETRMPTGAVIYEGGYRVVKIGQPNDWMMEHRYVAEQMIGRKLEVGEDVHHRNGVKLDNRPENLLVVSKSEHARLHTEAERFGLSVLSQEDWIPDPEGMAC